MILTDKVFLKITGKQIKFYKSLGYEFNGNDIVEVKIIDLKKGSHVKVQAKCDVCDMEREIIYKDYIKNIKNGGYYACSIICGHQKNKETNLKKYGVENTFQAEIFKNKIKQTCLKKYGVESHSQTKDHENKVKTTNLQKYGTEYVFQNEEIKSKSKMTNLKKYGSEHILQSEKFKLKIKNTRIKNGNQIPDDLRTEYSFYESKVNSLTRKVKKKLFENWNGYDYYDNEYIKENFNLKNYSPLYPTIDHKISIFYGYNNAILAEEIADIDNLCITKRSINSSKNSLTEKEFLK